MIDDIAEAMLEGCGCGSRLFKKVTCNQVDKSFSIQETDRDKPSTDNDDIAILIKEKGVYSVNLKNLTKRESKMDPLFVQDSTGKINVVLNPDT